MPKSFKIGDSVSSKDWGTVDKSKIWDLLSNGIDEGTTGVKGAVRETYAVVKADVNTDLTSADCWGPHHEVRDDGAVVLNRAGLIAATAALSGARSKPKLTPAQKESARKHLLRHYRDDLDEEAPESLSGEITEEKPEVDGNTKLIKGEIILPLGTVAGELKPEDIPVAPGIDVDKLLEGDSDPLQVVVAIPAGKNTRGWNYTGEAIKDIVDVVASGALAGCLGHQKAENVDWEFRTPVTHWVGAFFKDNVGYFRGVVDKVAGELKRWIRSKVIRTVSIFGTPSVTQVGSQVTVDHYKPISIDWTPLGRAGMPTEVVSMGEMHVTGEFKGSTEGSLESLRRKINEKIAQKFKDAWIESIYDDYVVVDTNDGKLYQIGYEATDKDVTVSMEAQEVEKVVTYQSKSTSREEGEMQLSEVKVEDLLAEMKQRVKDGRISQAIVGEMAGFDMGAPQKAKDAETKLKDATQKLTQVSEALGVTGEMDLIQTARSAKEALDGRADAEFDALVDSVIKEKVTGEQAQGLVRSTMHVARGMSKEEIAGEIDKARNNPFVKAALDQSHRDSHIPGAPENKSGDQMPTKRVAI